jgi:hypothetical protein
MQTSVKASTTPVHFSLSLPLIAKASFVYSLMMFNVGECARHVYYLA